MTAMRVDASPGGCLRQPDRHGIFLPLDLDLPSSGLGFSFPPLRAEGDSAGPTELDEHNVNSTCVNAVGRQAQPARRRSDRSGALAEKSRRRQASALLRQIEVINRSCLVHLGERLTDPCNSAVAVLRLYGDRAVISTSCDTAKVSVAHLHVGFWTARAVIDR